MRSLLSIGALLLWAAISRAEITVLPTEPGLHVVVAQSATPGRWLVVRAAPFGFVPSTVHQLTAGSLCIFEAPAGTYGLVLIPTDTAAQMETAEVVIGQQPDPDPDPGPDPDPDPSPIKVSGVVIVYEADDGLPLPPTTAGLQGVQDYVVQTMGDDAYREATTTARSGGSIPDWVTRYVSKMREEDIPAPALVLLATADGKEVVRVRRLPKTGAETIKRIQEAGG